MFLMPGSRARARMSAALLTGVVPLARLGAVAASKVLAGPFSGNAAPTFRFIAAADLPTISGDCSIPGGTGTSTVNKVNGVAYAASPGTNTVPVVTGTNAVTYEAVPNAALASMAAATVKGNNTGGSAPPSDLTVAQLAALLTLPTRQTFTSGSGTYTTPANCRWLRVRMVGGGGGGMGSGTASWGTGGNGGSTTFGGFTAGGGYGASSGGGAGPGGTASGSPNVAGLSGSSGAGYMASPAAGAPGGASAFGGAGGSVAPGNGGVAGATNTGGGGGGAGYSGAGGLNGAGGGAGAYVETVITNPSATYSYGVGAGGTGGTAGTSGLAGGAGGSGYIVVEEHYV